ncbi:hypothetical protein Aph01nite_13350 [Acrocarpospora phusangensis]|uniref:HTH cro/C1-type domain-containing protein n=1 Tax=Acrocarpospora phusangensis TaxID=1070424 RepID=A0A919Q979_9ACTN|nr:hypothetical protein [Acrocarpospora phusangensis]GIH23025.1 hypothetical protein Aph01nite_13350 [Acrocarpospora phusangensis]
MAEEVRATKTLGEYVLERRKQLGLSQDAAAWLAGVAKSTFRNVEGDRVEEARTWRQIERALGWRTGSEEAIRAASPPRTILSDWSFRIILKVIIWEYDNLAILTQSFRMAQHRVTDAEKVLEETLQGVGSAESRGDQVQKAIHEVKADELREVVKDLTTDLREHESGLSDFERVSERRRAAFHDFLARVIERDLTTNVGAAQFTTALFDGLEFREFAEIAEEVRRWRGFDLLDIVDRSQLSAGRQAAFDELRKDAAAPVPIPNSPEPPQSRHVMLPLVFSHSLSDVEIGWITEKLVSLASDFAQAIVLGKSGSVREDGG